MEFICKVSIINSLDVKDQEIKTVWLKNMSFPVKWFSRTKTVVQELYTL